MKRTAFIFFLISFGVFAAILFQTAIDPGDFSGQWYSFDDQESYLFRDGLIYNQKYDAESAELEHFSGAYSYCKDSAFLFAAGIEGLETEKELYLVKMDDVCLLCENKDGTGKLYFIRYDK